MTIRYIMDEGSKKKTWNDLLTGDVFIDEETGYLALYVRGEAIVLAKPERFAYKHPYDHWGEEANLTRMQRKDPITLVRIETIHVKRA